MNSAVLPSFWAAYEPFNEAIKRNARKAYRLWAQNPFPPSLHFKCIHREENVWSVRVRRGYRALGILESNTVTWFWIVVTMITNVSSRHKDTAGSHALPPNAARQRDVGEAQAVRSYRPGSS